MTVDLILILFTSIVILGYHFYMEKKNMYNDQVGKIAEMQFNVDCSRVDLFCAWPSIDKNGYDCIVDNGEKLIKVQVKSSNNQQVKGNDNPYYSIKVGKGKYGKTDYTEGCYDVLAIYLHPMDTWYFMSFNDVTNKSFKIYPESETSKYNQYRDNWDILKAHSQI